MRKNNPVQEAMKMLEKIVSVPKDRTLVLYTKAQFSHEHYHALMDNLNQLNEDGAVQHVIVLPHDELELKELTC